MHTLIGHHPIDVVWKFMVRESMMMARSPSRSNPLGISMHAAPPVRWLTLTLHIALVGAGGRVVVAAEAPTAGAHQVPWLAEVQPPATAPSVQLSPLWPATEPLTQDLWSKQRERLRQQWLDFLGPMSERPRDNNYSVLRTDELPTVTRELIEYLCEPDLRVQAYLLRPKGPAAPKSRAAIVLLHPTTKESFDPSAGVTGERKAQMGLILAEAGFVVICPRCYLWQDVASLNEAVEKFRSRHPKTLGMHKMLYDAQRATDVVAALPDVDPRRIGAFGHSLGAKETVYLAAFDERIRAGVASDGGLGLKSTNWDAPWYLGPTIRAADFPRNHHELIALTAPRALLIIAGEEGQQAADGERSWPYLQAAVPVYRLFGEPVRLGMINHRQGHPLPVELHPRVIEWLRTYTQ
jgi:dienelactone hydrolase